MHFHGLFSHFFLALKNNTLWMYQRMLFHLSTTGYFRCLSFGSFEESCCQCLHGFYGLFSSLVTVTVTVSLGKPLTFFLWKTFVFSGLATVSWDLQQHIFVLCGPGGDRKAGSETSGESCQKTIDILIGLFGCCQGSTLLSWIDKKTRTSHIEFILNFRSKWWEKEIEIRSVTGKTKHQGS